MMDRRRALMVTKDQWEDITPTLSFVNSTGTLSTNYNDVIRVFTSTSGSFRSIDADFTTSPEYTYKVSCESITVTKGTGKIQCRTANYTYVSGTGTPNLKTSQGAIEKEFSHNSIIDKLSIFCTTYTPEAGDVQYKSFRLWRRKI